MIPKNTCVIDLETCAESPEARAPFKPEFEANRTLKDPEKIKADLIAKETKFESEAALSSLTGKILCVGCWTEKKGVFVLESVSTAGAGHDEESDIVAATMDLLQSTIQSGGKVVGFCSKTFDLPFLCQRAWRLGVYVPQCLRNGRWWADEIVDLAEIWNAGTANRISLDHLAKALGVGAKNGDGADFGRLWFFDKPAALSYVRNDIELIRLCAERMLHQ